VLEFALRWHSLLGAHCERRFLNLAPGELAGKPVNQLLQCALRLTGDEMCSASFAPGELLPDARPELRAEIDTGAFNTRFAGQVTEPRAGRWYPRAMIAPALDCSPRDMQPFRVIAVDGARMRVDLNHPLAGHDLALTACLRDEPGGRDLPTVGCASLVATLTGNGPGLEGDDGGAAVNFFSDYPFTRDDDSDDALFYRDPRMVHHIDTRAAAEVTSIYARFLRPGMRILDLMSSWVSHLPDAPRDIEVHGLGMNGEELAANPRLSACLAHDLNREPVLPWEDASFDLVVCTASVEYLTRPLHVFAEVGRVLKDGGVFINTFSNRSFPPKAIRPWNFMHPFERVSLILHCYRDSGCFADLNSESAQGLPRPAQDKYAAQMRFSDPVFAVWGSKAGPLSP
jgi:hypothetical protein